MKRNNHRYHLDHLVDNLQIIGEDPHDIAWVMKEGVWLRDNSTNRNKFCDIIAVYQNGLAVPIELKSSNADLVYAQVQIDQGRMFIEDVLGLTVEHGKLVTYDRSRKGKGKYQTITIPYDSIDGWLGVESYHPGDE